MGMLRLKQRNKELTGVLIDINNVIIEGRDIEKELEIVKRVMADDLVEVTLLCNTSWLVKKIGISEYTDRLTRIEGKLAGDKLLPVKLKGKARAENYVTICESSIRYKDKSKTIEFNSLTYETLSRALGLMRG